MTRYLVVEAESIKQAEKFDNYLREMGCAVEITACGTWEAAVSRDLCFFGYRGPTGNVVQLLPDGDTIVAEVDGNLLEIRPHTESKLRLQATSEIL